MVKEKDLVHKTEEKVSEARNVNMDLLRVLSMMGVVCLHYFNHGGLIEGTLIPGEVNWFIGNVLATLCSVSVNCFVLISGYFLCTSHFKLKKIVTIWLQTFFYAVIIYVLVSLLKGNFSVISLVKSGLVLSMKQYWFVTAYLLLYAVSPFINAAIRGMDKKQHLLCCCVLLGIFSVLHNIFYVSDFGGVAGGSSFLWFCVLYMVSAYIRLYVKTGIVRRKHLFLIYLGCALLTAGERFAAYYLTPAIFGRVVLDSLFFSNNSILTVSGAIAIFCFFRETTISKKWLIKIVKRISPLAFGVYLIHDNPYIRPLLWGWIKPMRMANLPYMVFHMIVCVSCIFLCGCFIEWVRKKIFELIRINKLVGHVCDKIQTTVNERLKQL